MSDLTLSCHFPETRVWCLLFQVFLGHEHSLLGPGTPWSLRSPLWSSSSRGLPCAFGDGLVSAAVTATPFASRGVASHLLLFGSCPGIGCHLPPATLAWGGAAGTVGDVKLRGSDGCVGIRVPEPSGAAGTASSRVRGGPTPAPLPLAQALCTFSRSLPVFVRVHARCTRAHVAINYKAALKIPNTPCCGLRCGSQK